MRDTASVSAVGDARAWELFLELVDVMLMREAFDEEGLDRARRLSSMSATSSQTNLSMNYLSF